MNSTLICSQCDKGFTSRQNLSKHKGRSHGPKLPCNLCTFKTTRKDELENHKAALHFGLRFECDLCTFETIRKDKLDNHKAAQHFGVRFECEPCGKSYDMKEKLGQHMRRTHYKNVKLHSCDK